MNDYVEMPTGLILPEHVAEDLARQARHPTAVDVFAGCGGMSCGLIQAGWHVVAGVDHDPTAATTFMHNLGTYPCRFVFIEANDRVRLEKDLAKSMKAGKRDQLILPFTSGAGWISGQKHKPPGCELFFLGDVRKLTGRAILREIGMEVGELDCLVGGPPCQGFSKAGKQNVMDPRNSLVFEFARLICEMQPRTLVMENVPGIVNMTTPEGLPVIDAFCRVLSDGGFAGLDALKLSMKAQGVVGLVSNRRKRKGKK